MLTPKITAESSTCKFKASHCIMENLNIKTIPDKLAVSKFNFFGLYPV